MSLICANLLNQTLIDRRIYNSADILLHVDAALRVFLNKDSNDNQDGMDCAVFVIDRNNKTLEFAGAKRPLWYFQNDKMFEIKGSSKSIGGHEREKDSFVQHIISFKEKTIFYAYTDGYPDQIGGPDKKKFMTRNLRSLLTDIQHLSVEEQSAKINHAFESWQGESMQIDDVLLIGFELS
jgi:serine phosphatase RsbU (regulator of sigma subunit)